MPKMLQFNPTHKFYLINNNDVHAKRFFNKEILYKKKNREKSLHSIIASHIVLREGKKKSSKMICIWEYTGLGNISLRSTAREKNIILYIITLTN